MSSLYGKKVRINLDQCAHWIFLPHFDHNTRCSDFRQVVLTWESFQILLRRTRYLCSKTDYTWTSGSWPRQLPNKPLLISWNLPKCLVSKIYLDCVCAWAKWHQFVTIEPNLHTIAAEFCSKACVIVLKLIAPIWANWFGIAGQDLGGAGFFLNRNASCIVRWPF